MEGLKNMFSIVMEGFVMTPKAEYNQALASTLITKMEKRNFEASYCPTIKEAYDKVLSYFSTGTSIGWGGSMTLTDMGLMDHLKNGQHDYLIYDRDLAQTPKEKSEMFAKIVTADYFLMSTNAITLDGELINIDGGGNRVACLCHGPQNVIIVAGLHKVVNGLDAAISRARNVAAPTNTIRLNRNTPCTKIGSCANCLTDDCICAQIVTTRFSIVPKRIKVILVGEDCGY